MNDQLRRILLVEDDKVDQLAVKRLIKIENLPYLCVTAETVAEARCILETEPFQVVVSDYQLSDGTALDLLPTILAKRTPVIVTTGLGDEAIAVKALKAGAADYLIKDPDRNYLQVLPVAIEQAIQVEGDSRQVAQVLQQGEEREEDRHGGEHDADDPGGGEIDPVDQQA